MEFDWRSPSEAEIGYLTGLLMKEAKKRCRLYTAVGIILGLVGVHFIVEGICAIFEALVYTKGYWDGIAFGFLFFLLMFFGVPLISYICYRVVFENSGVEMVSEIKAVSYLVSSVSYSHIKSELIGASFVRVEGMKTPVLFIGRDKCGGNSGLLVKVGKPVPTYFASKNH